MKVVFIQKIFSKEYHRTHTCGRFKKIGVDTLSAIVSMTGIDTQL